MDKQTDNYFNWVDTELTRLADRQFLLDVIIRQDVLHMVGIRLYNLV